jgi:hypothetical protein
MSASATPIGPGNNAIALPLGDAHIKNINPTGKQSSAANSLPITTSPNFFHRVGTRLKRVLEISWLSLVKGTSNNETQASQQQTKRLLCRSTK